MTKSQGLLLLVLVSVLCLLTGYVGYRYATLESEFQKLKTFVAVPQEPLSGDPHEELVQIKTEVLELKKNLKSLAALVAALPEDIKSDLRDEFVPHPEYTSEKALFVSSESSPGVYIVKGDLAEISSWEDANELFLDYIYQQALVLDYDKTDKIFVSEIIPESLFAQMGFKKGDVLSRVDSQAVTSADDFRIRILEQIPTKIELIREGKPVTLSIVYEADVPNKVNLEITLEEFKKLVPDFLATFKLVPVLKDTKLVGVRIIRLDAPNPLVLIGLRAEDVLKSINGETVDTITILEKFAKSSEPLAIRYEREGKSRDVFVTFQK